MKIIKKEALVGALRLLSATAEVLCPVKEGGTVVFRKLSPDDAPWFEELIPSNSGKEAVFPQTEEVLSFSGIPSSTKVEPAKEPAPGILIGGPPCDARALTLLDKVFLEGEFEDHMYKRRRAANAVITKACQSPDEFCFCSALGVSPASTEGSDALFYESDSEYVFIMVTDKGKRALDRICKAVKEAGLAEARDPLDEKERGSLLKKLEEIEKTPVPLGDELKASLPRPGGDEDLPSWLLERFELPLWDEMSKRCLSCGACSYICPTCHCFAVTDSQRGSEGARCRVWDSCKFQEFLLMAGGHNPRPTKKERARQRFLHKLSYYPAKYGEYLCVGCGRCVRACSVGIHVPQVLADLREVKCS